MHQEARVRIVSLGDQRQPIDFEYLRSWSSEFFQITDCQVISNQPDADGRNWEYPDTQLEKLVPSSSDFYLTVLVVAAPLQGNYYVRRLSENRAVVSLYEIGSVLATNNFTVEDFLIQRTYALIVYLRMNRGTLPSRHELSLSHHAVRGCLFDMNSHKPDVVFSMHKPSLCTACQAEMAKRALDESFLPSLAKELNRIRKPIYFRIADWVKAHPVIALTITALASLTINLISNSVFEKLKRIWPMLA